jgi:tetratricopeptide (TPR) repeat protein
MGRRRRSSAQPARILKKKRLVLALGVTAGLLLMGAGAYAIQLTRQAPNLQALARKAQGEQQYATAIRLYEQYLEYRPKDADGHSELAEACEEYARELITTHPRNAVKTWEQAATGYENALGIDPTRHDIRRKLGRLYLGLQKYAHAQKHIRQLLGDPQLRDDPELWVYMSACEVKSPSIAADHLRTALKTGKADVETYLRLAYLLRREVNTPSANAEADGVMRRLVTQDRRDDLKARLARAKYFTDTDRRAEAQDDLKFAYEKIPGGKENLAVVLAYADAVAGRNLNEAREILRKALATHPDDAALALGLAEVETRAGRRTEAIRLLTELTGKLPDADPNLIDATDRLLDLGDAATAERTVDRISAVSALRPLTGYLTGRAKLLRGDWPSAVPLLTQAIPTIPTTPNLPRGPALLLKIHLCLATCYGLANDPARQAEAYKRAIEHDRSSIVAQLGLAEALAKMNRSDEAHRTLATLAPNSPIARVATAKLRLREAARQSSSQSSRLDAFWTEVGRSGPYAPEIVPLVATALVMQGEAERAEKLLDQAVREKPVIQTYISLAGLKGVKGPTAALAILADAEKAIGPNVELQFARATILARDPATSAQAIADLAKVPSLDPQDRFKLHAGLGELLLTKGKGAEGVPLLRTAAREQKYDLSTRLMLFDWALATSDTALRDEMLSEIRSIDGANGAITTVAEVTRDLRPGQNPTAVQIRDLTERLQAVRRTRDYWGRIPYLLGILARADGRTDHALELFQEAISKGERSESLVRDTVRLLMQRSSYQQAMELLSNLRATADLPPELDRQYRLIESVMATATPNHSATWVGSKELVASKNPHDQLLRGLVLAQLKKLDEAQKAFDLAQSLAPNAPEVYVTRIRGLLAAGIPPGDLRPVIESARTNLSKVVSPSVGSLALGQMYEIIGDRRLASDEYRKARTAAPNDLEVIRHQYELLTRANDATAATALLDDLIRNGKSDAVRWARRTRAFLTADSPQPHKTLSEAIKLIDANLADAKSLDDVRAKAFLQARDPFQRRQALQDLQDSLSRGPLSPDQGYRYALLLQQSGDTAGAEQILQRITSIGLLANPVHLSTLSQIQLDRNDLSAARSTLDRIKQLIPGQPLAVLSEAKIVAKTGQDEDLARAAKMVLALLVTEPPAVRTRILGRELEKLGCFKQAEEWYTKYRTEATDRATGHVPLVEYYIRRGRADDAIRLALEYSKSAPECPAATTCRLLASAARTQPESGVPDIQRVAWRTTLDQVEEFLVQSSKRDPKNVHILLAQAELADARGKYPEAIELFKKALDADPKELRPRILNNLAALRAMYERDGREPILRLIEEAIQELGPEPYLLDTRAVVHLAAEDYAKAAADLEAANMISPSAAYYFHLALCHGQKSAAAERDRALTRAKKLGLKKESLHPLEWSDYERLVGK